MDSIHITGIRCYGYIGHLPEERVLGQWFEVDLTLETDLVAAGKSDRLEDTLDYRQMIATVDRLVKIAKVSLIESLAQTIADAILEDDRVHQIRVKVTKPTAPIPYFTGKVAVEIVRSKTSNAVRN
jgi:7,8-dihydroneopterin aldolase/epimerase/oxygenase